MTVSVMTMPQRYVTLLRSTMPELLNGINVTEIFLGELWRRNVLTPENQGAIRVRHFHTQTLFKVVTTNCTVTKTYFIYI